MASSDARSGLEGVASKLKQLQEDVRTSLGYKPTADEKSASTLNPNAPTFHAGSSMKRPHIEPASEDGHAKRSKTCVNDEERKDPEQTRAQAQGMQSQASEDVQGPTQELNRTHSEEAK